MTTQYQKMMEELESTVGEHDLKDELMHQPDGVSFVRVAWENSTKNAVAQGYIAGVLDALRYSGKLSYEEYYQLSEEILFS